MVLNQKRLYFTKCVPEPLIHIPGVNTVNFALLVNYKEDFPNEDLQVVGLSLNNILDQAIDY